jgi:predicted RNA-binding Zn ribbon-like protein
MAEFVRSLDTLELVGGALCLDFVNTVNSRVHTEHDYLMQYSDLVGWAQKMEVLSPTQTNQLLKRAKQNPADAERALSTARSFRNLLYRIFSNAVRDSEPAKSDMELFVESYAGAISHGSFIRKDSHYTTNWQLDETFDALLWPIIYSAGEMLLSGEVAQVKECPGCGWLFLDTSKNQTRRWCSMNTCGTRDKMRRYYARHRN